MKKTYKYKLNIPSWPSINLKTLFALGKVYLSKYWSWYGRNEIEFIKKFSTLQKSKYVITTTSATTGLETALIALGIKPGDEVIVPAYTWISTVTAVAKIGAIPVIVDIDPNTLCIDPKKIREAISKKTKAVIPVHLFSALADMDEIMKIAEEFKLKVIEDCAHAHCALYKDKGIGSIGDIGVFSFQQTKLMCAGEGGACTTNSNTLADKLDRLNHIGYSIYSSVESFQDNNVCSKNVLTEFQTAILSYQCDEIIQQTIKRYKNSIYLEELLSEINGIHFQKTSENTTRRTYFYFVIIVDSSKLKEGINKYNIIEKLNNLGIPAQNGWGCTVYNHQAWNLSESSFIKKDIVNAKRISEKEVIVLPNNVLFLNKKTIKKIGNIMKEVFYSVLIQ